MTDQRPIYPGFHETDDMREVGYEHVSELAQMKRWDVAKQLNDDATDDHATKHTRHQHPWCSTCEFDYLSGVRGVLTSGEITDTYVELTAEKGVPERLLDSLETCKTEGRRNDLEAGLRKVPEALREEVQQWLVASYRHHVAEQDAKYTPRARVLRYLLLHNKPPADTFDPDAVEDTGFDSEYLDRSQLDDLPAPEPLIDGVLMRHAYGLLTGRDGTYKTFTGLDWSLCLATGKPWQEREVERTRVLYIAGEGAHGIAKRVDAWEHAWQEKVDPDWFVVRRSAVNLFRGGPALDDLLQRVQGQSFGLVVVDTLRRASGGANSNGDDMGVVVDNVERIKRATDNGSVLVVAHTQRNDEDARGFTGIEDDADLVWHAKAVDGRVRLELRKMKDGPDGLTVELKPLEVLDSLVLEGGASALPAGEDHSAGEAALLSTLLVAFSETPATSTALRDASRLPKTTYYRAINQLVKRGHVENVGTKRQPLYQAASHVVPGMDIATDLRLSQQSHVVPVQSQSVPPSPTPLRGGTWDSARNHNQEEIA